MGGEREKDERRRKEGQKLKRKITFSSAGKKYMIGSVRGREREREREKRKGGKRVENNGINRGGNKEMVREN